jgi:membrane peptidoglycan carboxypeptidase
LRSIHPSLLVNRRLKRDFQRRHSLQARLVRLAAGLGAVLGLVIVAALVAVGIAYTSLTKDLPSIETLPALLRPQGGLLLEPTRLYDRTGQHLLYTLENPGIQRRYLVLDPDKPDHISPQLVQVTLALVDPDFWSSPGFDTRHLASAQPATLAERLVDDLLLPNEPASLRRTLRMRLLAAQLTSTYGRTQVLEWYLNSAYYGHLAYGIDSAAQLYLGKTANQLSLEEAALLVPVVDAPALNPIDSSAAALEREQAALERLLARGVISSQDYTQKKTVKIALKPAPVMPGEVSAAFNQLVVDRLGERYGRRIVERGGMKVITSLDYDLQVQLNCSMRTQLMRLEGQPSAMAPVVRDSEESNTSCDAARLLPTLPPGTAVYPKELGASGVVLNLQTGQVLALAGDTTLDGEKAFLSARQPGSLLSPFVAVAAFARGMGPASLVWDVPASLPADLAGKTNPDEKFHGPVRLRLALANDYLVPTSQILAQIGPVNVWRLAEPLGLSLLDGSGQPSELLFDGGRVSPLAMARAYATFASLGSPNGERNPKTGSIDPVMVLQVEGQAGATLYQAGVPENLPVLDPQLAYLVNHVLSDESARWPSLGYPNALEIGRPVGAKIGQISAGVSAGSEAWTVGYTPQRLAVIWLGLPDTGAGSAEKPPAATEDPGSDSKTVHLEPGPAAGIWHALMQYAVRDLPREEWGAPQGITHVVVCDPSGRLPTVDCPTTVEEVFLNGNEPTDYDSLYKTVQINRETHLLATVFTPLELIQEQTFLIPPPEAEDWARASGVPLPPTGYDSIQAPAPIPGVQITEPVIFGAVHGKVSIRGSAAGDGFSSYRLQVGEGLNPRSWLQVGSESTNAVENGVLGSWDTTSIPDGLYALRLSVLRKDQTLQNAILQVTVDNTPPAVRILYPAANQAFLSSERQINFQASVSDGVGAAKVEWLVDGKVIGTATEGSNDTPYNQLWQAVKGQHSLVVRATDLAGNASESAAVGFTVP